MEYKTPMIAEKMGVSPKVVMRIVQQLNLELKKNKFGHYIFHEEDVQKIMESYHACQETAATVATPTEKMNTSPKKEEKEEETSPLLLHQENTSPVITMEQLLSLQKRIDDVEYKLLRSEEQLRQKADNVVQYQLLQHRSEIEELHQKIEKLEATIQHLEARKQPAHHILDPSIETPKRRNKIASIFGL